MNLISAEAFENTVTIGFDIEMDPAIFSRLVD
jgi:hypothetical protein